MKKYLKQIIRILYLSVRFFTAKRVMAEASALTYSTLLAIVPILAVVFAIARGFGYNKYIEIWFRDALSSQPQAAEVIIGFVNGYLIHTKSGVFLGVGLIFMLYTVLMLMNNVEETFNQIWRVSNSRPIFRSFTNYLAMFLLFPILVIVMTGFSVFMETIANSLPNLVLIGSAMRILLDFSPYLLISLLFIALYVYMPNTKVRLSCAILPGILSGVSMQLLQLAYIHSQMWVTGYNAIYASFIGTTNEPTPLVDPSGSRRFICVTVDGSIDFETPVEYYQLYAQLKYEVEVERQRYFLTKEEEAALMQHNLRYQKMSGLGEMLMALFEKPEGTSKAQPENGQWLSVKNISERLKQRFKGAYQADAGTLVKIGQFLSRPEYKFESERKTSGWMYWVKDRT